MVIGGALFALGVSGLAVAFLLARAARAVLTVVLFRYADTGALNPVFPAELLERGLRAPAGPLRRLTQRLDGDRIRRLRRRVLGDDQRAAS